MQGTPTSHAQDPAWRLVPTSGGPSSLAQFLRLHGGGWILRSGGGGSFNPAPCPPPRNTLCLTGSCQAGAVASHESAQLPGHVGARIEVPVLLRGAGQAWAG